MKIGFNCCLIADILKKNFLELFVVLHQAYRYFASYSFWFVAIATKN